jgi:hypothetical protein
MYPNRKKLAAAATQNLMEGILSPAYKCGTNAVCLGSYLYIPACIFLHSYVPADQIELTAAIRWLQ